MRHQKQAIAPDVQAVARALRKKNGADEALRLIEHLPDKDALDLLVAGLTCSQQHLTPFAMFLILFLGGPLLLSAVAWIGVLFGTISWSQLSFQKQGTLILLLFYPLLLVLFLDSRRFQLREEKNFEAAMNEYAPQVQQIAAVDPLLRYLTQPFLHTDTRRKCWEAVRPLIPRFSDQEARSLSHESCDFLRRLVATGDKNLPPLSSSDKIAILLVLAARREESTRHLIETQRVYPALREVAKSILDDWEK